MQEHERLDLGYLFLVVDFNVGHEALVAEGNMSQARPEEREGVDSLRGSARKEKVLVASSRVKVHDAILLSSPPQAFVVNDSPPRRDTIPVAILGVALVAVHCYNQAVPRPIQVVDADGTPTRPVHKGRRVK